MNIYINFNHYYVDLNEKQRVRTVKTGQFQRNKDRHGQREHRNDD